MYEKSLVIVQMMEWAICNNSANILTHLRDLGYAVPAELIERYPEIMREYLFIEYPLKLVPKFTQVELEEPELNVEEDSLDESDEPLNVVDTRSTLKQIKSYHLMWRDISLRLFSQVFLDPATVPLYYITHIDLSHNLLVSVPSQFFRMYNLESINLSHNAITSLPSIDLWSTTSKLQVLNVSHNQIVGDAISPILYRKNTGNRVPFQDLWYLDLSHNHYPAFPNWILHFSALRHLNIGHNPKVSTVNEILGVS